MSDIFIIRHRSMDKKNDESATSATVCYLLQYMYDSRILPTLLLGVTTPPGITLYEEGNIRKRICQPGPGPTLPRQLQPVGNTIL
jgi:hypothetical protein